MLPAVISVLIFIIFVIIFTLFTIINSSDHFKVIFDQETMILIIQIVYFVTFPLISFISKWGIKKHIWNSLSIPNILTINSTFSLTKLTFLNIFYLFLSIITLGLFLPIRSVLITKYIVKYTKIKTEHHSMNVIENCQDKNSMSGIGEVALEGADMGAFDVGI